MIMYRSPANDKERAALLLHLSTSTPNNNIEAANGNHPFVVPTANQNQINRDTVAPTISSSPMLLTDENENSSAGQFEDAAESASFVYTPPFLQHVSSSSTMMAPFANAFLMNQQQKQVPPPPQQVPSTTDMQLQFQAAATKAHLSMLKQQQERDFYLAMANSNPSTTPPPSQPNMFYGPQFFPMQSLVGGSGGSRKRQSHSAQAIRRANAKGQQPMTLQPLPSFIPMANAANQRQQIPVMPLSHQMTVDDSHKCNMTRPGAAVRNTVETASIMATAANHRNVQAMPGGSPTELIAAKVTAASFESRPLQAIANAIAEDSFPTPDVDSWMYKLEDVHPSPVIQTIEGDAPIRVTTVVSDTETKQTPIAEDHVTRYDVLAGRGGKTNHHEGNIKFRRLVTKYKKDYLCAKKSTKRNLVSKIVYFVRQGRGRFLQRDPKDGYYYEIGDERAFVKLAQSMREGSSVASICREFAASHHNRDNFEQQMIMAGVNKTSNKRRTPTRKSSSGEEQRGANPSATASSLPFRKRLV